MQQVYNLFAVAVSLKQLRQWWLSEVWRKIWGICRRHPGHCSVVMDRSVIGAVGFRVPVDPCGSNTRVHAEITPPAYPCLTASLGSKLHEEQHKGHKIYTGSGHHCGVIPYSSVWCGGLPLGLMMNNIKGRTALLGSVLMVVVSLRRGRFEVPLYYGG